MDSNIPIRGHISIRGQYHHQPPPLIILISSCMPVDPTIPLSALLALIEKTVLSFSKKQEHLSGVILESLLAIFCMSLRNSPPDQRDRLLRITEQNVSRLLDDIMTAVSGRTSSESIDAIVALCANLRAVLSRTSTDRDSHSSVFSSGFLC